MKFAFIAEHLSAFPLAVCCHVLKVSRAGFYAWRGRPPSKRARRRVELAGQIRVVHQENRCVYGSPRIYQVLKTQGVSACENLVARIMKQQQIRAKTRRRFVPRTTDSVHQQPVAKNLLKRKFIAEEPDRKWVADITYIPTGEGWLYLAGVLDLCSRKIVGWSMTPHMKVDLVAQALQMITKKKITSVNGNEISIKADTICVHGDGKKAAEFAEAIYQSLKQHNIDIKAI